MIFLIVFVVYPTVYKKYDKNLKIFAWCIVIIEVLPIVFFLVKFRKLGIKEKYLNNEVYINLKEPLIPKQENLQVNSKKSPSVVSLNSSKGNGTELTTFKDNKKITNCKSEILQKKDEENFVKCSSSEKDIFKRYKSEKNIQEKRKLEKLNTSSEIITSKQKNFFESNENFELKSFKSKSLESFNEKLSGITLKLSDNNNLLKNLEQKINQVNSNKKNDTTNLEKELKKALFSIVPKDNINQQKNDVQSLLKILSEFLRKIPESPKNVKLDFDKELKSAFDSLITKSDTNKKKGDIQNLLIVLSKFIIELPDRSENDKKSEKKNDIPKKIPKPNTSTPPKKEH